MIKYFYLYTVSNRPISYIDGTLSCPRTPGQSGPRSVGNEGILRVPQSSSIIGAFLFQTIQFSQTVLIQTIQFSICMHFSSIQPIDRALLVATIPGQSGPGSNGNEGVLHISQSPSITGASLSYCLVSFPGHLLGGVLPLCRDAFGVWFSRMG